MTTTTFTVTCNACGTTGKFSHTDDRYHSEKFSVNYDFAECEICGSHSKVSVECDTCHAEQVLIDTLHRRKVLIEL
jgi:primosomal protein N'